MRKQGNAKVQQDKEPSSIELENNDKSLNLVNIRNLNFDNAESVIVTKLALAKKGVNNI